MTAHLQARRASARGIHTARSQLATQASAAAQRQPQRAGQSSTSLAMHLQLQQRIQVRAACQRSLNVCFLLTFALRLVPAQSGAYALHHMQALMLCITAAALAHLAYSALLAASEVNGCISSCLPPCCWPLTSAPWSCCRGCSCTSGEPDGCICARVIRDWTGDGCGEESDCGRHRDGADPAAQPCSGAAHPCSSGACCAEV